MMPVVGGQVEGDIAASLASQTPPTEDRLIIKWLEIQPDSAQIQ